MSIALVYLARGAGDGLTSARDFFDAYRAFPPGCPHDLIVIAKGWLDVDGRNELQQLAQAHSGCLLELPDDGFDWGAYMRLAPILMHDWLCFLNTYSRPRVGGWLNLLRKAAKTHGKVIGAVGATASWGTIAQIPRIPLATGGHKTLLIYPFRLIRYMVQFVINTCDFPTFPNPHLRSNAFIVRRKLFVDFSASHNIPRSKRDAYMLESGRTGFTAYLAARGLEVLVTGANGKAYGPDQWIDSGTFRVPEQPNLLVEDNQTLAYQKATLRIKRILEMDAWGKALS